MLSKNRMSSATATTLHNKTWAYFIDYDVEGGISY
jgi:hypothetical protein